MMRTAPRKLTGPKFLDEEYVEPSRKEWKTIKVFRSSGFHIKKELLEEEVIEDALKTFTYRFYDDKACNRCEYRIDRHSDTCEDCAAYKGVARTSKVEEIKNNDYLTLPLGDTLKVNKWFKRNHINPKLVDKFAPEIRIKPFKFIRRPYGYQKLAVDDVIEAERGVLQSPPRTGKTVMGALFVRRLLLKTLIIAHQREWLDNFMETFIGSKKMPAFTDLSRKRIKFCKTLDDFENTDICIATFQQFLSPNGKKILHKIRNLFSIVIMDEVQFAPAKESVRVLAIIRARYRLGLSGTPNRKDRREVLVNSLLGPVVHKTTAEALKPTIIPLDTGRSFEIKFRGQSAFVNLRRQMENNPNRARLICEKAIKYAEQGHFVIIPVSFVSSINAYVRIINRLAEETIARPFSGQLPKDIRRKTIEDARNYRFKILVANIALISTGVNIPRASCLIDGVTPTSNLPKAKQRFSRILTPMPGKPEPIIVYVMDGGKQVRSMRRNEFWNCLYKEFKPNISTKNYLLLKDYFNQSSKAQIRKMDI
jgi:superfamily II DNA or RNA helicase